MKLIVGLGNPGGEHAAQRHNVGFMALDRIAERHGLTGWRARHQGQVLEGRLGAARVVLLKPGTFMNRSGQSVGEAMRYLRLTPAEVLVIHDELDLAPGKVRLKAGGGHAGHNGLRSIHQHLGDGYGRVRVGIGHPGHKDRVTGHVLHDFAAAERAVIEAALDGIAEGAPALAAGDEAAFAAALARHTAPPPRNSGTRPPAAPPAAPEGPPAEPPADPRDALRARFARD